MAELTPLEEKLGEVLGLAQAAQRATEKVKGMEGAEDFHEQLDRLGLEAEDVEQRTDEMIDAIDGKKTAIRDLAQETKTSAIQMMQTYLEDEEEALDGFEFLTMAEAAETGHWEIVREMASAMGADAARALADDVVDLQHTHQDAVREACLALAREEVEEA
jgi:hypothetical protein